MKKKRSRKTARPIPVESIARLADQSKDISRFFTNAGRMMEPLTIQRVNVDFTVTMLQELERASKELNVSRQAVNKTLVRQALDQHYLAKTSQTKAIRR